MEKRQRVLLFGNSVVLGSIGASLSHHPGFEILPLAVPPQDVKALRSLRPDVILYDVEASRPEAAVSLLETCPDLLLIGVSPDSNRIMLWSGRQLRQVSTQDLVSVISRQRR